MSQTQITLASVASMGGRDSYQPLGPGVAGAGVAVPGTAGPGVTGAGPGVTPGTVAGGAVAGGTVGGAAVPSTAGASGTFRSSGTVGDHANSSVNRVRSIILNSSAVPCGPPGAAPVGDGPSIVRARLVFCRGGPFGYHRTCSIGGSRVITGCEIPRTEIGTSAPIVSR